MIDFLGGDMDKIPLSETEYKVLKAIVDKGLTSSELRKLSEITGIEISTLASVLRLLAEKGLVKVRDVVEESFELSEKGISALREGLPEEKLLNLMKDGVVELNKLSNLLGPEANIAIGQLKKKGFIEVRNGRIELITDFKDVSKNVLTIKKALDLVKRGETPPKEILEELRRRGLIRRLKIKHTYVYLTEDPKTIMRKVRIEISRLTHDILKEGRWREAVLRPYNVLSEPPKALPARKHFLVEFIEIIRDIMKELGFKEVEGPMIEVELFNFDALFQPQDHPAREIHDTLWISEPSTADLSAYKEIIERARVVHEKAWKYKWDPMRAARIVLRSQTTAVSARVLSLKPRAPMRYFTIGKVFRADAVDASHLSDFHQLDGIEGWEGYTFRDLLGTLKEIADRLGLSIKFKPAYFPFTEPSVEGYVRLPNGRWLELFGAGLFRPEVLEIAGIKYPVGAWGFGIERLAAAYYGINDIRLLYSKDYDFIRSLPERV
jgi:phenylalanyl-tRNA synthetase alpha chain